VEQAKARKRREMLREREEMEARLAVIRAKEKAERTKYLKGDQNFKKRKTEQAADQDDEEQFILDDYDSDGEHGSTADGSLYSAATLELMAKMGMGPSASESADEESDDVTKVSC
jgi:chromosome transmission fidelity protein 1